MRKDLGRTSSVIAKLKNPNFPPPEEIKMEPFTTSVNVNLPNFIGNTNVPNQSEQPRPKANIKSKTFEFNTMKKDLMKGISMAFGYPDKQLP
jgi:hypothetical protein